MHPESRLWRKFLIPQRTRLVDEIDVPCRTFQVQRLGKRVTKLAGAIPCLHGKPLVGRNEIFRGQSIIARYHWNPDNQPRQPRVLNLLEHVEHSPVSANAFLSGGRQKRDESNVLFRTIELLFERIDIRFAECLRLAAQTKHDGKK